MTSATNIFNVVGGSVTGSTIGSTISIAATTSSASASFAHPLAEGAQNVRIYNAGPNTAFIRWGVGAQTAVSTDVPLPVGVVEGFFKFNADTFAAICSSGTATVYVTPGNGL